MCIRDSDTAPHPPHAAHTDALHTTTDLNNRIEMRRYLIYFCLLYTSLLAGLGWRQLLHPTAEGSSLAQAVVVARSPSSAQPALCSSAGPLFNSSAYGCNPDTYPHGCLLYTSTGHYPPGIYGFGGLYNCEGFSFYDYRIDYGYYGKAGEEYLPFYVKPEDK